MFKIQQLYNQETGEPVRVKQADPQLLIPVGTFTYQDDDKTEKYALYTQVNNTYPFDENKGKLVRKKRGVRVPFDPSDEADTAHFLHNINGNGYYLVSSIGGKPSAEHKKRWVKRID